MSSLDDGVLCFSTAPPPTFEEVTQLVEGLRPALSLKQLTYAPQQDLVRYRPRKGTPRLACGPRVERRRMCRTNGGVDPAAARAM
jgi:hypothetical protein